MTSPPSTAIASPYADAVPVRDFVRWTDAALRRFGFHPSNSLPLVAICRDELMLPFATAIAAAWGPAFDAASLAAMPYLGRTGLSAALGHAPGEDGRHRFVVFAFPHIGIDDDGAIGQVWRPGVRHPTSACGALVALRERLLAEGPTITADTAPAPGVDLDPQDVEASLLRLHLRDLLDGEPVPDLVGLTEAVRSEIVLILDYLVGDLNDSGHPVDHAVLSGVVIHRADGTDVVASGESYVVIDRRRQALRVTRSATPRAAQAFSGTKVTAPRAT